MCLAKYMVAANTQVSRASYVAILKAKQGELLAVQATAPDRFIPLLEVVDPGRASSIARAWPHTGDVAWIQPINMSGVDDQDWADQIEDLFEQLRSANSAVVPVITPYEPVQTYAAVKTVTTADQRGIVLRVDCEEVLEESPGDLSVAIEATLSTCGVAIGDCDLVVDAGLVDGGPAVQSGVANASLAALPQIAAWRSIVVAFSAFPEQLSAHVPAASVRPIPRTDAAAYAHLVGRWTARPLVFGDYAVGVPTYADAPWSPIPNIRYAVDGEWIIHRATSKRNPSPQYIQLAVDVAAARYFAGAAFSPGDRYIADVASGVDGPGNAGSYLRAAMSRHFHVVLDALATRGAP